MKVDWRKIVKSLMRPVEVVLNEPVRETMIEQRDIGGEIPELEELFGERSVESFIHGIVFRGSHPTVVLGNGEPFTRDPKAALKLRSVVMPNILNPSIEKEMETVKEIRCMDTALCGIHPCKAELRVRIHGGEDGATRSLDRPHHRVEAEEESGSSLACELTNPFLCSAPCSFAVRFGLFSSIRVESRGFDDALNLPETHRGILRMGRMIHPQDLRFPIPKVGFSDLHNPTVLCGGICFLAHMVRGSIAFFEEAEILRIESLLPGVEDLWGDPEVPTRFAGIVVSSCLIPDEPLEAMKSAFREPKETSRFPPSIFGGLKAEKTRSKGMGEPLLREEEPGMR